MKPKVIIASGPVIVEDNKIVLLNIHGDTDFWKFCGGKVEDFSTGLKENAKREAKEEMGIDIEILDETPYITHTYKKTDEGDVDVILVHYLANRVGEISPEKDIREWAWHDLTNLPPNLAPNIVPALKHYGFLK